MNVFYIVQCSYRVWNPNSSLHLQQYKRAISLVSQTTIGYKTTIPVADLRGARGTPLGRPNSINFMQFLGKFGKIVCWRPPPGELAPPPRGNPGSATAYNINIHTIYNITLKTNILYYFIFITFVHHHYSKVLNTHPKST